MLHGCPGDRFPSLAPSFPCSSVVGKVESRPWKVPCGSNAHPVILLPNHLAPPLSPPSPCRIPKPEFCPPSSLTRVQLAARGSRSLGSTRWLRRLLSRWPRGAVASNWALGFANSKGRATANPAISTGKGLLGSHAVWKPTTRPSCTRGPSNRRPPTSPTGHTETPRVQRIYERSEETKQTRGGPGTREQQEGPLGSLWPTAPPPHTAA